MEHGGVVLLYHPCVEENKKLEDDLDKLKGLVSGCLRRHIITPYQNLDQPFALIVYGCKMLMDKVDDELVRYFIRMKALNAPEDLPDNGKNRKE